MAGTSKDPTDQVRAQQLRSGVALKDTRGLPGYILMGAAVLALMVCLAAAAMGYEGWTIAAGAVAIVTASVGSVWVYVERCRVARLAQQSPADSTRTGHSAC